MAHFAETHQKPDWSFFLLWILVTSLCIPIAFFLDLVVLRVISSWVGDFIYVNGVQHITEDYLAPYSLVPLIGLLTGIMQYVLLRNYLPRMGLWIFATVGGWFLGILLLVLTDRFIWTEASFNLDFVFIMIGLSIGIGQWILLRQRLPGAGWWILANVAGWGLLALVTTGNSVNQYGLIGLGLFPACTTAAMLALLMKQFQRIEQ